MLDKGTCEDCREARIMNQADLEHLEYLLRLPAVDEERSWVEAKHIYCAFCYDCFEHANSADHNNAHTILCDSCRGELLNCKENKEDVNLNVLQTEQIISAYKKGMCHLTQEELGIGEYKEVIIFIDPERYAEEELGTAWTKVYAYIDKKIEGESIAYLDYSDTSDILRRE